MFDIFINNVRAYPKVAPISHCNKHCVKVLDLPDEKDGK